MKIVNERKNDMMLSVVIPVYGCRAALEELYQRLAENINKITDDYEIIMVNDACPQNSWEIIQELSQRDRKIKGIELSRNFGQMKAILAGLDHAKGDWVVVMDCDLQDRPEEIQNLYNKAMEGYDIVFARRAVRNDSRLKIFISSCFYSLYKWACDMEYDGAVCNFSIINRHVVESYCRMREQHRSYVMYLNWLGFRQTAIDVQHDERFEGKSSYNMKKRFRMAVDILTSQSIKLLRITVALGLLMALTSFLVIIGLAVRYFTGNVAMGWTSLISTMFLIGGMIIAAIGVMGIYVGNIFEQVKERPLYVIRQVLNDDTPEQQ